jgi:hypothetical protein
MLPPGPSSPPEIRTTYSTWPDRLSSIANGIALGRSPSIVDSRSMDLARRSQTAFLSVFVSCSRIELLLADASQCIKAAAFPWRGGPLWITRSGGHLTG